MKVEIENAPGSKPRTRASDPNALPKQALVVNDEPATTLLIQDVLRSAEVEAVVLGGSSEAESHLRDSKFDVILVGLRGSSVNGNDFVRRIRKSGFNRMTPIIVISDDQRPDALPRGFEAGATFFVYRPIDKAHLTRLIRVAQGIMEHERRRFRRVPVQVKVCVRSKDAEYIGETIDLSLNGALVKLPHTYPVGTRVDACLYLAGEDNPVVGRGSVVRVESHHIMGILFDRLTIAESSRLQDYLLPRISH